VLVQKQFKGLSTYSDVQICIRVFSYTGEDYIEPPPLDFVFVCVFVCAFVYKGRHQEVLPFF
jgi:hypothetical protein